MTEQTLDTDLRLLTGTFKARLQDVKRHYVGRDDVVDLLALATLCREHVLLVGRPGTAKSSLLDRFSQMLGARYFSYLLTQFTEPAELFGPLDVKIFENERRYQVNTTDMLPESEIVFLDEIFQGSSAILNTLLALVNERKFHNGSTVVPAALLTMLGSANEIPDDPVLAAFGDRFLLRQRLDYVPDDDIEELLGLGWSTERDLIRRDARVAGNGSGPDPRRSDATFGLDNLVVLQQAMAAIELAPIRETFAGIVRSFRADAVNFSDRRLVKAQKVFAASALLAGLLADITDLGVLADMWADQKDEATIQRIVTEHGVPVAASRHVIRVPAEILVDLQELTRKISSAKNPPELREVMSELRKLNIEVGRDHRDDPELGAKVKAQQRAVLARYRERFGEEGLDNV